jgi:hypothetical protein
MGSGLLALKMKRPQLKTGETMKDIAASAVKAVPPIGANWWLWLQSHDINWYVAAATLVYIGLQSYYLIRNKGRKGD